LGVFTPYLWGEFLGDVHTSLFRQAPKYGLRLLFIRASNWRSQYTGEFATELCDAWMDVLDCVDPSFAERLVANGKPYVSLVHRPTVPVASSVRCDNALGLSQAMAELEAQGHRRFALVGDLGNTDMAERAAAFRQFHHDRGWSFDETCFVGTSSANVTAGWEAAAELDARKAEFTALFACCDQLAVGTQQYLKANGRRVPDDVAVLGFDNTWISREAEPQVSTLDQRVNVLVRRALQEVRRRLDRPQAVPRHIRVAPQMKLRASTHPVGAEPRRGLGAVSPLPWEIRASMNVDNEVNRLLNVRLSMDHIRSLLSGFNQGGRRATLARVEAGLCRWNDGPAVPAARFGGDFGAEPRANCLTAVLPCLDNAQVIYVLAIEVPLAQVSRKSSLAFLAREWEALVSVVERFTASERLEQLVRERTQSLEATMARLEEAQHKLVSAEKLAAVGEIASRVAHEINSPLAGILSSNAHLGQSLKAVLSQWGELARGLEGPAYQTYVGWLEQARWGASPGFTNAGRWGAG
jgi:LacI family transcriptional regulator